VVPAAPEPALPVEPAAPGPPAVLEPVPAVPEWPAVPLDKSIGSLVVQATVESAPNNPAPTSKRIGRATNEDLL
jgi:hypothetical protein